MKKFWFFASVLSFLVFAPTGIAADNPASDSTSLGQCTKQPIEKIQARDFSYLFKSLDGISENQLKQHYTLYTRYVSKLNEINEKLRAANRQEANATHSEYRALKVDRAFANNGVVLHELYFSNLTPQKTQPSANFLTLINRDFGSYENYIADLRASAKSARNGWAVTVYNCRNGKIENYVFEFHDFHIPANMRPVLVLDAWEHAYMVDYGIDRDAYINAFLKNIDWQIVSQRLELALKD